MRFKCVGFVSRRCYDLCAALSGDFWIAKYFNWRGFSAIVYEKKQNLRMVAFTIR